MKKLVTIAALLGAVCLSFGQGLVDFENFNNSLISTNSVHNGPATGPISGSPGTYYFMLLSAETTTTTIDATLGGGRPLDQGGWSAETQGLLLGKNTGTPGLMNGNYTTDPGTDVAWPSGYTANFAVVGWSANLGSDWFGVLAWWNAGNPNSGPSGWFGISDIAQDVVVGGGGYPVPTIFGPTVGYEVQGFTLNYYMIPEPSTFALAALGIGTLCAFRRRMESFRP